MEWMEIKVLTTTEAADLISEILLEMGSEGTVIEDRNDVFANQRPEGQWDIIDPAIADRIGEDVKVSGFFPADERLGDALAALRRSDWANTSSSGRAGSSARSRQGIARS